MGKWVVFFFLSAIVIGSAFTWKSSFIAEVVEETYEKEKQDLQLVHQHISQANWAKAHQLIRQYQHEIEAYSPSGKQWLELFIHVNRQQENLAQLVVLHQSFPHAFEYDEASSLLVADQYLVGKNTDAFHNLRNSWAGREMHLEKWVLLDSDHLVLQQKLKEAANLLQGISFDKQADETERLYRLALIHVKNQQPKQAWSVLTDALRNDPENPLLHSYRGKILEGLNKNKLAFHEYLAAYNANPKDLFLIDQLADFHLRQKNHDQALKLWSEALDFPSLDVIWAKALFWNRMTKPISVDFSAHPVPRGSLNPLVTYMLSLPEGEIWDETAFQKLPSKELYVAEHQSVFWMRLINLLKNGREVEAANLIRNNHFQEHSWDPELEQALYHILTYRQNLPTETFHWEQGSVPFVSEISDMAKEGLFFHELPPELSNFIKSDEVFAATFLFSKWNEAALHLLKDQPLSDQAPEWLAYEITLAIKENRGNARAIHFVNQQRPSPLLALAGGELLIDEGELEEAHNHLTPLIEVQSEIGLRAAQLLAELHLRKGETEYARQAIEYHPDLFQSIEGQEVLAKIALHDNEIAAAESIYQAIANQSTQAKTYFAEKAIKEKNWKRAQKLTLELLADAPNDTRLLDTLKQIQEAT